MWEKLFEHGVVTGILIAVLVGLWKLAIRLIPLLIDFFGKLDSRLGKIETLLERMANELLRANGGRP